MLQGSSHVRYRTRRVYREKGKLCQALLPLFSLRRTRRTQHAGSSLSSYQFNGGVMSRSYNYLTGSRKRARKGYNRHHRKPKSAGGTFVDPINQSIVPVREHVLFHQLFGAGSDFDRILRVFNNVWFDPDYELIIVKREKHLKALR